MRDTIHLLNLLKFYTREDCEFEASLMKDAAKEIERLLRNREEADQELVDRYRDPTTGTFSFPGDVARIIQKFERDIELLKNEREDRAKLIDDMLKEPGWANHPRSRLALTVAARTIRRGRHLSSMEKWENIKAFCEESGDD